MSSGWGVSPAQEGWEGPLSPQDERLQEADIQKRPNVLGERQGGVWLYTTDYMFVLPPPRPPPKKGMC